MRNEAPRIVAQVSVDEAARDLRVSHATIRNWVRAGHLESPGTGRVCLRSIDRFLKRGGAGKLTHRANKSLAGDHDHASLSSEIQSRLSGVQDERDCSVVSEAYETGLSNAYKNREGIYYTPASIADEFFKGIHQDCSELTFCDPCCGSGNFLVAALKAGFKPENVFGFDTDPIALEIARRRMNLITGQNHSNIKQRDFLLSQRSEDEPEKFDVIITNPPWGKKLQKDRKASIADTLDAGRSRDTAALFLFASKRRIRDGGFLGLLLPDAFLNIGTFQDARIALSQTKIIRLYDFGRPFKGLMARATGFLSQLADTPDNHAISCQSEDVTHSRDQASFFRNPATILNIDTKNDEQAVVERLLALPHMTLEGRARWALGIVTGDNKKFCTREFSDGFVPVYKGAQIKRDGISGPETFIPADLSLYQQVAPTDLLHADEKIVYRFISSDLVFFCDAEQRLFLNSANMLVLNEGFPVDARVLTSYLNSRLINWFFKKVFGTHKILRSDLESIPIFVDFLRSTPEFSESRLHQFLGVEEVDGTFGLKDIEMRSTGRLKGRF